jgi:hypothetical protein
MIASLLCLLLQVVIQVRPGDDGAGSVASPDVVLPGRVLFDGTKGAPEDTVFTVDGEPVKRKEWTDLVTYRRLLMPKMPLGAALVAAVHDIARYHAVLKHYNSRVPELEPKLAEIKAKIAELKAQCGSDKKALMAGFGALCNQYSEDPTVRGLARNGQMKVVQGTGQHPFDYLAFHLQPGEITEPIPTLSGYEIFLLDDMAKGATPILDVCLLQRLLVWWDPAQHHVGKYGDRVLSKCKVEVVDPAFKQIVPVGLVLGLTIPFPEDEATSEADPRDIKVDGSADTQDEDH